MTIIPPSPPTLRPIPTRPTCRMNYALASQIHALTPPDKRVEQGFQVSDADCLALVLMHKQVHLGDTCSEWVNQAIALLQKTPLYRQGIKLTAKKAQKIRTEWESLIMRKANAEGAQGELLFLDYFDEVDKWQAPLIRKLKGEVLKVYEHHQQPHAQMLATLQVAVSLCDAAVVLLAQDIEGATKAGFALFARMERYSLAPLYNAVKELHDLIARELRVPPMEWESRKGLFRAKDKLLKALNDHVRMATIIGELANRHPKALVKS